MIGRMIRAVPRRGWPPGTMALVGRSACRPGCSGCPRAISAEQPVGEMAEVPRCRRRRARRRSPGHGERRFRIAVEQYDAGIAPAAACRHSAVQGFRPTTGRWPWHGGGPMSHAVRHSIHLQFRDSGRSLLADGAALRDTEEALAAPSGRAGFRAGPCPVGAGHGGRRVGFRRRGAGTLDICGDHDCKSVATQVH